MQTQRKILALQLFAHDRRGLIRGGLRDRRLFMRPTPELKLLGASMAILAFGALCSFCQLIQLFETP